MFEESSSLSKLVSYNTFYQHYTFLINKHMAFLKYKNVSLIECHVVIEWMIMMTCSKLFLRTNRHSHAVENKKNYINHIT